MVILTDHQKAEVLREYKDWVDEVSDDLEDKCLFTIDETVHKVIELTERKVLST